MSYFETVAGVTRDELLGGQEIPLEIWNVNVGASAVIERGMLLASDSSAGEYAPVTSENDASKCLVIADCDFTASADHHVTQAYASGLFNAEKVKFGGNSALTIEPFMNSLRKSNIHVTSIKNFER